MNTGQRLDLNGEQNIRKGLETPTAEPEEIATIQSFQFHGTRLKRIVSGKADAFQQRPNGNKLPVVVSKMVGLLGVMTKWWKLLGTPPENMDTYKAYSPKKSPTLHLHKGPWRDCSTPLEMYGNGLLIGTMQNITKLLLKNHPKVLTLELGKPYAVALL